MSERELTITKLERHPDGYWQARVTVDGTTIPVHRRWGSWMVETRVPPSGKQIINTIARRHVLPHVAEALQAKVRTIERRESKQQQEVTA